jgi:hypothetical protein
VYDRVADRRGLVPRFLLYTIPFPMGFPKDRILFYFADFVSVLTDLSSAAAGVAGEFVI